MKNNKKLFFILVIIFITFCVCCLFSVLFISNFFPTISESEKKKVRDEFLVGFCEKLKQSPESALQLSSIRSVGNNVDLNQLNEKYLLADLEAINYTIVNRYLNCQQFAQSAYLRYDTGGEFPNKNKIDANFILDNENYHIVILKKGNGEYLFDSVHSTYGVTLYVSKDITLDSKYKEFYEAYKTKNK